MPGRTRSTQPRTGSANIVIATTACRAGGELADARIGDGLLPGDQQHAELARAGRARRRRRPPRLRRPHGRSAWRAGRRRQRRRAPVREPGERSCRPCRRGPDQIRTARSAARIAVAELIRDGVRGRSGRGLDRAGGPDRDHLGAGAPGGPDPEVDDRRALLDRVVADHDDEVGLADRRERRAEARRARCVACSGRTTASEPSPCRTSRDSASACSTVSEPESASSTGPASQQPLGLVERSVPGELLEAALSDLAERVAHAVAGVEVREAEAALVAEPALVDLGMVAGEDPLDLPLARGRGDVAADRAEAADATARSGSPTAAPRSGTASRSGRRPGRARSRCRRRARGTARPRRWRSSSGRRGRVRSAGRPRRPARRSACSGSRGCSARGRARSPARSGSASRTSASGTSSGCCRARSGTSGPGAGTRRPCRRRGSRADG